MVVEIDQDKGAYNLVFIKLKNGEDPEKALKELNQVLKDNKANVKAINWKDAAGALLSFSLAFQIALVVFVFILFFIAVIIIMNTLSMAAMDRTNEIGMMRAVGAQKDFIGGMFVYETIILSAFFGGLGVFISAITANIIYALKIPMTNDFFQLVLGNETFSPVIGFGDVLLSIVVLILVTVSSVIYPVIVARKITPLDAIARE